MKKQLLSRISLTFSLIAVILLTGALVRQPKEVNANANNAIRDNQTGTILFMGSIVDPK